MGLFNKQKKFHEKVAFIYNLGLTKVLNESFTSICHAHEAALKYKSYKNKLTSILRFAKKAYYSKMLEKQKTM